MCAHNATTMYHVDFNIQILYISYVLFTIWLLCHFSGDREKNLVCFVLATSYKWVIYRYSYIIFISYIYMGRLLNKSCAHFVVIRMNEKKRDSNKQRGIACDRIQTKRMRHWKYWMRGKQGDRERMKNVQSNVKIIRIAEAVCFMWHAGGFDYENRLACVCC